MRDQQIAYAAADQETDGNVAKLDSHLGFKFRSCYFQGLAYICYKVRSLAGSEPPFLLNRLQQAKK